MKKIKEIKLAAKHLLIISIVSFLLGLIAFSGAFNLFAIISLGMSIYTLGVQKNNFIIKSVGLLVIVWILYIFLSGFFGAFT